MRINAIAKDINRKQTEGHLVNKRAQGRMESKSQSQTTKMEVIKCVNEYCRKNGEREYFISKFKA